MLYLYHTPNQGVLPFQISITGLLKETKIGRDVIDFIEENGFVTRRVRNRMLKILCQPLVRKNM